MKKLSKRQLDFLNENFGKTEADLEKLSADEWFHIREESFMISADELMDEEGNAIDEITETCEIAESIADMKYSDLMESA